MRIRRRGIERIRGRRRAKERERNSVDEKNRGNRKGDPQLTQPVALNKGLQLTVSRA